MIRRPLPDRNVFRCREFLRTGRHQRRQRRLCLEWLEPRWVLDGLGPDAYDAVSAAWFQKLPLIEVLRAASAASVASATTGNSAAAPVDDKWIVRLTEPATSAAGSVQPIEHLLDTVAADFQVIRGLGLPGQVLVRSFAAADIARAALAANPHVAAFEPERIVSAQVLPDDPDFPSMVDLNNVGQFGSTPDADIDAPEAWDMNTGSPSVVVGVIDSGIDVTHPDLYLNIWLNQGEIPAGLKTRLADIDGDQRITFYDLNSTANSAFVRDLNGNTYIDAGDLLADPRWSDGIDFDGNAFIDDFCGWNFRQSADEPYAPNDPRDALGHGTHVAGTIGAIGNNGRGVTGINWRSSLMSLKFLDDGNQGLTSNAIAAVNYANMMRSGFGDNVRVLNASWGQSGGPDAGLQAAIENAGQAGMLFVAAAGNGNILGQGIDLDREPFYPAGYGLDTVLAVAATGPHDELARFSNFGATTVEVGAPGIGVLSTLPGGRYGTANGTSMAAPHVAGAAALIWAEMPDASVAEVRQAILATANALPELQGLTVTGGRLNAVQALNSAGFAPAAHLVSAADIATAGGAENLLTVRYTERGGIDVTSLNDGDLVVTRHWGPKDPLPVTLVPGSVNVAAGGTEVTATYRLAAPGGEWDVLDYGRYTIRVVDGQVRGQNGLFAPAGALGGFAVRVADHSVFYVDTFTDGEDAAVGDGIAADAQGDGTLRAAVQEANAAAPAPRTIILEGGTYELSLPRIPDASVPFPASVPGGSPPESPAPWSNDTSGDLDVRGQLTIVGDEAWTSTVDAGGLDRAFKVYPGARLVLRRAGVTGGAAPDGQDGGGILTAGTLELDASRVVDNLAAGAGGGIAVWDGQTRVLASTVGDNRASGHGGGGLLVCNQATLEVDGSTIARNVAPQGGGGILSYLAGPIQVTNSTFSGNDSGSAPGSAVQVVPSNNDLTSYGRPPSLSADGRLVAFSSFASSLVPADTNGAEDVFVYDRQDRSLERVSVGSPGGQGTLGNRFPALSADGRFVAFVSLGSNGVLGDTNGLYDVFLYDRQEQTVRRVGAGASSSMWPSLSADGRFVAFESDAGDLVPEDWNGTWDIFVYDGLTQKVKRVSVASDGTEANGSSYAPALSADGQFVAFTSDASNLVTGDTNGQPDIFVYDRQTLKIQRVNVASDGTQAQSYSDASSLSADGRFVAYRSEAANLVPEDTNGSPDIFVYDRQTLTVQRVSVAGDGAEADGPSDTPSLSADGRFVAFESGASNLVPGDTGWTWDVFVYDRQNGTVVRVSVAGDGTEADQSSYFPSLSADGGVVAFASLATNLVPGDTNTTGDIFIWERQSGGIESATANLAQPLILESVTVAENRGAQAASGTIVTHNSLYAQNANTLPGDLAADVVSEGHNLVSSAGIAILLESDRIASNAGQRLGPLQDNGGPAWTHALLPGSPALDAGDPADFPASDQRGLAPRPQDGDGTHGTQPDIGAFEAFYAQVSGTVFLDRNGDGTRNPDEPGLVDQFVYVDANRNGSFDLGEPVATTAADDPLTPTVIEQGAYSFGSLQPGSYWIGLSLGPSWTQTSGVERVSVADDGAEADAASEAPSLSADGRFVAFSSNASNLVPGDTNWVDDVFLYDRQDRTIRRISTASDGTEANFGSGSASLSADGRFVTFVSLASNLVPGDSGGWNQIYVYDRQEQTVERVSAAGDGTPGNGGSSSPSLSADGRFVVFASEASNLVPDDWNGLQDIFVYDRQTQTIEGVSVRNNDAPSNGPSSTPSLSGDGRFVAFRSDATKLVPGDTNGTSDVFVYDRQVRTMQRVSVTSDGTQVFSFGPDCRPWLSADGRFVAYASDAWNLVPDDWNWREDVFVYDRQTLTVQRVSVASDGTQAAGASYPLSLSADGRFVAFASDAWNLVPEASNSGLDIFVYDRQEATVRRVSEAGDGTGANAAGYGPSLSADGRFVAYASEASNLVDRDNNAYADVFVTLNQAAVGSQVRSISLFAGQDLANVEFGLLPDPGEIRGRCFQDVIANGVYDPGEAGWQDWTVFLDVNANGRVDYGELTTLTDADGEYVFSGLPAEQEYRVALVLPSGYSIVLPTADNQGVWRVSLPAGSTVRDRDFGVRPALSTGQSENALVQGWVFEDRNGNRQQEPGEMGIAGATLFLDLNDDGVRQYSERQLLSDSDDPDTPGVDESGRYAFESLGSRPYTVRILEPQNHAQTTPVGNRLVRQIYSLAMPGNALGSPQDVAAGDFNGDGASDLAAAVFERNSVALLLNDGAGVFGQTPIEIALAPAARPPDQPRGFGPVALLAADFNRSGQPDLAVVNNTSSNVAILMDFNGTGFSSEAYVTVGTLPSAVTAGDVDGDGDPDLVVTNEFHNTVSILRNNGQGSFTADATAPAVGNHPFGVATGDFNQDGRLDLAVADFGTYPQGGDLGDVRVLLADGSGGFTSQTACDVGFGPAALVAEDLDGDGHLDLAVANFLSDNVTVCRGSGDGTFTAAYTLPGGSGPMDIDAVDIEGDGDLDLLVTNGKSQTVGILRNRLSLGVFEFEPAESFGVANFPGASQISLATGDLDGNQTIDLVLANSVANSVAVHLNSLEPGAHRVALTGTETVSGLDFGLVPLDTTLKVASLTATRTGFVARFNRDLTASALNLYDQGGVLGPADVTVTGATVGPVRGSLVLDPGLRKITFIKTGGPLESDTYTVTLVSGANAFRDADGNLLDGNGDGTAGDNCTASFVVAAAPANQVTVSLPDFARGYGQPVNLPADNPAAGLPLQLSNGLGVSRLQMTLRYDPSLLEISAFTLSSSLAARGAVAAFQVVPGGTATLDITAVGGFAAASGPLTVGAFTAAVPATALYGAKHVLNIDALHVFDTGGVPTELPSVDDDAIHVAAFFGDNNGSRSYNAPDVTLNQRLIGLINTGFSAYQLADPLLLADITRNGQMQANDTVSIQRVIGQVPVANVPALPTGLTPPAATGADPKMYIPQDLSGSPGDTVEVPVMLLVTEAAGITLSGFDLAIEFDPARFTVSDVQLGSLVGGLDFVGLWTNPAPGQLLYTASSATGTGLLLTDTEGSLAAVTLTIGAGAATGPAAINLLASFQTMATAAFDNELNELVLTPAPSNAADDSVDGLLTVNGTPPGPPPTQNPDQPLDTNDDGEVTAADVLAVINYLNRGLPQDASVLYVEPGRPITYGDVNGDRRITAQDVLAVVNHLNAQSAPGGEGEGHEAALWALLDEGEEDEQALWELLAEDQVGRGKGRTDFNPFGTE